MPHRPVVLSAESYRRAQRALTATPPEQWRRFAACADKPTQWWFCDEEPRHVRFELHRRADAVCGLCPVRDACLAHALHHEEHGRWAGFGPEELERLRRALHVQLQTPQVISLRSNRDPRARIRWMRARGWKITEIADELGLSESAVSLAITDLIAEETA